MKKYILIPIVTLCLFGLFYAGILRSLFIFLLTGAIPGTTINLSPDVMFLAIIVISVILSTGMVLRNLKQAFKIYKRYISRKKLISIPAFRRPIRTRQA